MTEILSTENAQQAEPETFDLSCYDLSLNSVYKDYPPHCLPEKFNKPTGKAKDLKIEHIDVNIYEQEANMVAFRVTHPKIAPWIKSLSLLYYDTYGKMDKYKVSWYHDPQNWNKKQSGKKAICIDLGTSEIQLMYKITFHISTGVIQAQGIYKDHFVEKDFPKLKVLVENIAKANNIQDNVSTSAHSDSATVTAICNDNENISDSENETLLKVTDPIINSISTLETHKTTVASLDSNNNVQQKSDSVQNMKQNSSNERSLQPFDEKSGASAMFQEVISRMEQSFSNALEKITTQQSNLFQSKLDSVDKFYTKTLEAHNEKFSQLLDRFDTLTTKCYTSTKENVELKNKLSNINHTNMLEQEVLKSNFDLKCSQLKHDNDAKSESICKLDSQLVKVSKQIADQASKIHELETAHSTLCKQMEKKEEELISQKLHNSRDDSVPFKVMDMRSQARDKPDNNQAIFQPLVTIVGTSNTKGIDPKKMSSRYSVDKITAYSLDDTDTVMRNITAVPDVFVFHSITNDLKSSQPEDCVSKMSNIIDTSLELYPETKIVLSLPTPRSDNSTFNNQAQLISIMLKEKFKDHSKITLCDNSNLAYKGEPVPKFIDSRDGFHLSQNGVAILASNMRDCIDKALDLPKRQMRNSNVNQFSTYRVRGRGGYSNGNYRGGRGGRGR